MSERPSPLTERTEGSPRSSDPSSEVGPGVAIRELLTEPVIAADVKVFAGRGGLDRVVRNARVQKSGLALVGHFHGLEAWRIQILGATEISFLESLEPAARAKGCRGFAELRPCAVVVTRGVEPPTELVDACEATDTPLLGTTAKSSTTITRLHGLLDEKLAPHTRIHGVMVTIFGVGVLLLGRSGIGKSECALDLVMRGHRLVADDAVECHCRPPGIIVGSAAALLGHHIEIRGLGILNAKDLFGVTSVTDRVPIDLVVQLSDENETGVDYDRLGLDDRKHRILGVDITEVTVPVRPGRDVATILEVAARNELLKRAGHHGARAFRDRLERALLYRPPVEVSGSSSVQSPEAAASEMSRVVAKQLGFQSPGPAGTLQDAAQRGGGGKR